MIIHGFVLQVVSVAHVNKIIKTQRRDREVDGDRQRQTGRQETGTGRQADRKPSEFV